MNEFFQNAANATLDLQSIDEVKIKSTLFDYSEVLKSNIEEILKENQKDLEKMDKNDPKYDRLLLDKDRIVAIANDVKNIAENPFNVYKNIEERTMPNGMHIVKKRVPMGVVGMIYESRPNVTVDAFSICFKTQNVCVLKGAPEADFSNKILVKFAKEILKKNNLNENIISLMEAPVELGLTLIQAKDYIDVVIPRGGSGLINFVRNNARVPVIETGAGVVHTYVDKDADKKIATDVIFNSKTRRVAVCNTLDTIVIHKDRLVDLYSIIKPLVEKNVILYADDRAYSALGDSNLGEFLQKANDSHFGTEFLSLKASIKTVDSLEDGISHIRKYTSKHSECIVSSNKDAIKKFEDQIDAAVVYANTSTAFTDGGQFGMMAEIGISTQKLHARGPFALDELTTYKWIVEGNGNVRS